MAQWFVVAPRGNGCLFSSALPQEVAMQLVSDVSWPQEVAMQLVSDAVSKWCLLASRSSYAVSK